MAFAASAGGTDFWGWDEDYALHLLNEHIGQAKKEYEEYLGVGNEMLPRASAMFAASKDLVAATAKRCVDCGNRPKT